MRLARWAGLAALLVGYPVLMHYTNTWGSREPGGLAAQLGALLSVAPLVIVAGVLAWRAPAPGRWWWLSLLALSCAGLWLIRPLMMRHFDLVYWLQHAGMYLVLGVLFGRTLLPGQEPLCTRFARVVHAPLELSPRHAWYAGQVTVAWTVFFAAIVALSTGLFFAASLEVWSVFANFVTLPLVVLMFVVEYYIRSRMLPNVPPVHILDSVRVFMGGGARKA